MHFNHRNSLIIILMLCLGMISLFAKTDQLSQYLLEQDAVSLAKKSAEQEALQLQNFKTLLAKQNLHKILHEKSIRDISPADRMRAYNKAIKRMEDQGISIEEAQKQISEFSSIDKTMATGSISGTITLEGEATTGTVQIYDELGFWTGWASANWQTGEYTATDLKPGLYFVVTSVWQAVDEFYDNIPSNNFENFRQVVDGGFLVEVKAGQNTEGIDFALDKELIPVIAGTVYEADGVTPIKLTAQTPTFVLTTAEEDIRQWDRGRMVSSTGAYAIRCPFSGDAKLALMLDGYKTQYFNQKDDWESADIFTIPAAPDTIKNIDFVLDTAIVEPPQPGVAGGAIAGKVMSPGNLIPALFGLVFAFDMADTSIAGFGVSTLLGGGDYMIDSLDAGDYMLYADDYGSNMVPGAINLVGEYYEDAQLPSQATLVTVTQGDTAKHIDFELALGGGMKGHIKNDAGQALDSLMVIAFDFENVEMNEDALSDLSGWLLNNFANIHLALSMTDANGNYTIDGLPEGNYIVRTVSLLSKYSKTIFDQTYNNVETLLQMDNIEPVEVKGLLKQQNIDFTLNRCGFISGHIYDEDGTTPLEDVVVMAVSDTLGMPVLWATDTTGTDGAYRVPMLHTADYKLFAMPLNFRNPPYYLTEFWEGEHYIENANPISVLQTQVTENIDFTLDHGGFIEGLVYLAENYRAGMDTSNGFPVVAYDSETGQVAGVSTAGWMGGFRMGQMPSGTYYLATIPGIHGFGATYFGGGETYDDPRNQLVTVNKADSTRADITITPAYGCISGTLTREDNGEQMMGMVFALDETGHAVSFTTSGWDNLTNEELGVGEYKMYGIREGDYFIRTWMMFGLFQMVLVDGLNFNLDLDLNLGLTKSSCFSGCFAPQDMYYGGYRICPFADMSCFVVKMLYHTVKAAIYSSTSIKKELHRAAATSGNNMLDLAMSRLNFKFYDKHAPSYALGLRLDYHMDKPSTTEPVYETTGIDFQLPNMMDQLINGIEEMEKVIPDNFALKQNYPNPFNPQTYIQYQLPEDTKIELSIYNMMGQKIKTLYSGNQTAGTHQILWNGHNNQGQKVSSGMYIYQIKSDSYVASKKLIFIK